MQIDFAKVAFGLASISTILMIMAINTYDRLWWVALGFGGFGFFGYAAFPMSLELAVEESYPIDASISEACVHIQSNSSAIFLEPNSIMNDSMHTAQVFTLFVVKL